MQAAGSLLGDGMGTVLAEQVRRGGLALELTLSCDVFVDPADLAQSRRESAGESRPNVLSDEELEAKARNGSLTLSEVDAVRNSRSMSSRMLVLGITARESSPSGWNALA